MTLRANFPMMRSQSPLVIDAGHGEVTVAKDWYIFLVNLYNGLTQGLPQSGELVTLGASPFTYRALLKCQVFVTGGTVSAVEFSRDGTTFYATSSNPLQLDFNDYVRVTYTVSPTLTAFPM